MYRRVAAIYDIHGNACALEAVLREIERCQVDAIVVGGDLAWGPQPALVMERLISLPGTVYVLRGNADREVAGRYGVEQGLEEWIATVNQWCADQLSAQQLTFLRNLPESVTLSIEGAGDVLFVHGSPRSDEEAIRKTTPDQEIAPMIASAVERVIVCGHTHVQFDRVVSGKRIVNAGSVGLPTGAKGACWLLIGPDVELRETAYDVQRAAEQFRRSGMPFADDFATHVLHPPAESP